MPEIFLPPSEIPLIREDFKNAVDDLMSSYGTKIENIDHLFETTHLILNEFQQPLLELKDQRENIKAKLQDLLAKNEHLRRKDFDWMMQSIVLIQVEKEKGIKDLLNNYFLEQRSTLNLLKENLAKIKEALANGEGVPVKDSQDVMGQILTQQDQRKQEIALQLKEFQKEQQGMMKRLLELLAKGRELRIRDLKTMLKEFDVRRTEVLAHQEERKVEAQKRRQDIQSLLGEFRKRRLRPAKISKESTT